MSVKLYFDHLSQPSRAIIAFCKMAKIPHEPIEIRLNKKANLTEDFKKINPFQKVPVIDDGGFLLFESHAILQYLASKYNAEDPYYPKDLQQRARVDCYLHWHHSNTRICTRLFQLAFSNAFHHPVNYDKATEEKNVAKALSELNDHFLKGKKFLINDKNMTIADISAACELSQLLYIDYDISKFGDLKRWFDHMMSYKEMKEAHETFFKLMAIAKSKNSKK